jgi:FkbM family methyltransferase
MKLLDTAKDVFEANVGLRLSRPRPSIRYEALRSVSTATAPMVFDVGANVGQFARFVRRVLPAAEIHCFEPVPETYNALARTFAKDRLVHTHALGLGDAPCKLEMVASENQGSTVNSLAAPAANGAKIMIDVRTLDGVLEGFRVDHIDLLKIDVEGWEVQVLKGAEGTLRRKPPGAILVEVSLLATDGFVGQTAVSIIRSHLAAFGYEVVALGDIERYTNPTGTTWWVDALFKPERR